MGLLLYVKIATPAAPPAAMAFSKPKWYSCCLFPLHLIEEDRFEVLVEAILDHLYNGLLQHYVTIA